MAANTDLTFLTLINQIPQSLAASADFWIQQGPQEVVKVTVPASGQLTQPSDPTQPYWNVYVVVNGMTTPTMQSKDPNATFICDIGTFTPNLLIGPEDGESPDNEEPCPSSDQALERISNARKTKDLVALTDTAEGLVERWQRKGDRSAAPALLAASEALNSVDFGDPARQRALLERYVAIALEHLNQLDVEQEIAFLFHLPARPQDPSKHREWPLQRSAYTSYWLRAQKRLDAALDPAFDPEARPPLKIAPPLETSLPAGVAPAAIADPMHRATYEAALEAHRQELSRYGRQKRLRVLEKRFRPALRRFLLEAYSQPLFDLEDITAQLEDSPNAGLLSDIERAIQAAAKPATAHPLPVLESVIRPEDDFAGRSKSRVGVGEHVHLSFSAAPACNGEDLGDLKWFVEAGSGALMLNRNGEALYRAGGVAETAKLSLKALSGPHAGKPLAEATLDTATPTGAYMVQAAGTQIWHTHDTWSVGFQGNVYLTPNDVSYAGVEFSEGVAASVATGWLSPYNGIQHQQGVACTITGNQVNGTDTVSGGPISPPPPYADGSFTWPIPWQYRVNGGAWVAFMTANHINTSNGVGRATVEKAGAGPFAKLPSDSSSNYTAVAAPAPKEARAALPERAMPALAR